MLANENRYTANPVLREGWFAFFDEFEDLLCPCLLRYVVSLAEDAKSWVRYIGWLRVREEL